MSPQVEAPDRAVASMAPRETTGFSNVLVCPLVERGVTAAMRRVSVALADDAHVTVIAVLEQPTPWQRFLHGSRHLDEMLGAGHRHAEHRVRRCVDAISTGAPGDVVVEQSIEVGHPATSLVGRAVAAQHDLVVVIADDDDRALVRRVMRTSPCPVWVARPTRARRPRVLVAIDPEPDQAALNSRLLDVGAAVVGADGDRHALNAWQLYGEATMRSSAFLHVETAEIERQRREVGHEHELAVERLVAPRDDAARWQVHVVPGAPVETIRAYVGRLRIDTLVIGTVARSGLSGAVMGNTAERLVDDVPCSVVTVKPPDAE